MTRLRVGVVGTGALGRHHARIYSTLETTQLVAVADTSADRGQAVAQACGTRWLPDFRSLFGEVDAVSIAVPTTAHEAVATEFLDRGIAVLVEKPLAPTVAQAAAIVAAAERTQTTLQVGHVERFNPAAQVARRLVRTPRYIRAERASPYAFRSTDIGVVLDVMIHDIDLILDLAGGRSSMPRASAFRSWVSTRIACKPGSASQTAAWPISRPVASTPPAAGRCKSGPSRAASTSIF